MGVAEMSCLRSMCGVTKRDRVRNGEIGEDVGFKEAWVREGLFGHVERIEGERLVKKIYRAEMDGVKGCLSDRGLTIPEAK